MSGEDDITVTEETFNKIMDNENIIVTFKQYDGTWKVINKNFIITGGVDKERTDLEKLKILDIERKKRAAIAQKAAQEEVETDVIEKYIK
jgi:hypothetical protein